MSRRGHRNSIGAGPRIAMSKGGPKGILVPDHSLDPDASGSGSEPPANPDDEIMAARNRDDGVGLGNDESGSPPVGPLQALREAMMAERFAKQPRMAMYDATDAALVSVEEQLAALQRALRRYGDHEDDCAWLLSVRLYPRKPCSCGLAELLTGARGSSPSSPTPEPLCVCGHERALHFSPGLQELATCGAEKCWCDHYAPQTQEET